MGISRTGEKRVTIRFRTHALRETTRKKACKSAYLQGIFPGRGDPEYCNSKRLVELSCHSQEIQREGCSQAHTGLEKKA